MAQSAAQPVIEVRGARLGHDGRVVVDEVELEVGRGDFLAVVGPDGAGKSTLLRAVVGVTPPIVGLCTTRGRVGYAPQAAVRGLARGRTVHEVVALGLLDVGAGDAGAAARRALQACGLSEAASIPVDDLDAAERTRVVIARALAGDPVLLVLDDPTGGLEPDDAQEVTDLLRRLHAGGLTLVVATRAVEPLARVARRIAFIRGGRLVAGAAAEMLVPERLAALYEPPRPTTAAAGADPHEDGDDDALDVPIPSRDASPEERRAAARARREAARARLEASRSGRTERAQAPASAAPASAPASAAPAGAAAQAGAPRWLWPAVAVLLLGGTIAMTVRAREERRAHDATVAALDSERRARAADARAAQERELDALEEAALLRTDLDATRLDREAIARARDDAAARAARLEEQRSAAEANRAALNAELQRTGGELATARLEVADRAAALDEARRALGLLEQEKAGLSRVLDEAAAAAVKLREQLAAREAERDEARARVAAAEGERDEARARVAAAEGEREAARARAAAAERVGADLRARLAAADEALARERPTRTPLKVDAAQVTSSVNVVVRVADGRVLGPAVQAALDGSAAVSLSLRLSDPGAAGRLRLRADVQGEPASELARSVAAVDAASGEHVRFWLDRAAAARCARGFARDGFTLVLSLDLDPARPDEALEVRALDLVVAPLLDEAARRLRALDRGED